jgi:hypothetical protein
MLAQNSTVRNSSFSEASPSARNSAATGAQPVPVRPNSSAALQVLVNAHGKGRPPSASNLHEPVQQDKPAVYRGEA